MKNARRVALFAAAALFAAGSARVAFTFAGARVTGPATWKDVDRLVSEQKFEEAASAVGKIREAARAAGDEADDAKALVREVQLRTALHGYETSVRFLKDQPWPKGLLPRTTLRLFYAQSLVTYAQAYWWEIGQREKVSSTGAVDLKAWTRDEIQAEAVRAYADVWKDREALGRVSVNAVAEFVEPNNYPKGIRGTLRDAASYLFVDLLADTSGWRPEQANEVFALDARLLIAGDAGASRLVKLDDAAVHPLLKLGAVLDDLEAWHAGAGEKEAALEARLERLRRLDAALSDAGDRAAIRKDLAAKLPAYAGVPWWSMGKAQLADFTRAEDKPGNLVRARALALEAVQAYPKSVGAATLPLNRRRDRGARLVDGGHGGRRRRAALDRGHAPQPRGPLLPRVRGRPRGADRTGEGLQPPAAVPRAGRADRTGEARRVVSKSTCRRRRTTSRTARS